jgi:NAD(P)-dependent dehydrogenase (short-subunit alcohol dehydrogenase family)
MRVEVLHRPSAEDEYGFGVKRFMENSLAGKVAVVTGASSGIGLAVTRTYLECGAKGVVAVFRRREIPQELDEWISRNTSADDSLSVGWQDTRPLSNPASLSPLTSCSVSPVGAAVKLSE